MTTTYQLSQDDPVATKLLELIPGKANELGWFTEDTSLSEYVIMMFSSPKSQDDIAKELTEELLQPEDGGAHDFAEWLFKTIAQLRGELPGASDNAQPGPDDGPPEAQAGGGMDTEMSGIASDNIPTGPKSMRNGSGNGNRSRRNVLGQISKHMDRSNDAALHRVKNAKGNERINTHNRDGHKGPRNAMQNRMPRGPGGPGGRPNGPMNMPRMPGANGMGGMNMNLTPQQQMQMFQLYEQQAKMMSDILNGQQAFPGMPPAMGAGPFPLPNPNNNAGGRSLFDRVEVPRHNGNRQSNHPRGAGSSNNNSDMMMDGQVPTGSGEPTSSMEVESSQPAASKEPGETPCKFNLACNNKDCPYAHQSPAAHPGTPIDVKDKCTFGAACKNKKCVANHPSPAQKIEHQAEQDCKFFPNCFNPSCPFKHPEMPVCRNGGDCQREGCKFTHLQTKCKFNPCKNRSCPYKHDEGQRGTFTDKVWTADGYKPPHVSDRKFVDDEAKEELIIPGGDDSVTNSNPEMEVVT